MPEKKELTVKPRCMERSVDACTINDMSGARLIENVDPTWLDGQLRRGDGMARTKVQPYTAGHYVLFATIAERHDGARMLVWTTDDGGVYITPVSGGADACSRSLIQEQDMDFYGAITSTVWNDNFNKDSNDITMDSSDDGVY